MASKTVSIGKWLSKTTDVAGVIETCLIDPVSHHQLFFSDEAAGIVEPELEDGATYEVILTLRRVP